MYKAVAFAPDGKSLAAARMHGGVVLVYDANNMKRRGALFGKDDRAYSFPARSLSYSRDGALLAAPGVDNAFVVWNVATGLESFRIPQLNGARAAVFSPAVDLLASAGPGNDVIVWDLREQQPYATLKGHSAPVTVVAFSSDGKLLASGSKDKSVRLWSVDSKQQIGVFENHAYPVHSVAFSPDTTLLATYAGELKLWELAGGKALSTMLEQVDMSAFEIAHVLAWAMTVSTGRIVPFPSGGFYHPVSMAIEREYPVLFSPDGKRLAVMRLNLTFSGDQEIVILDVESKKTVTSILCQCFGMAFSPDSSRLVTGGWHGVRLWSTSSGKELHARG